MVTEPDDGAVLRLAGTWMRVTPQPPGEPSYPAELVLTAATPTSGRYVGRRGPSEPALLVWDAGTWEWLPSHGLQLTTWTDAQVVYPVELTEPDLVVDVDGTPLRYRRTATRQPGTLDPTEFSHEQDPPAPAGTT